LYCYECEDIYLVLSAIEMLLIYHFVPNCYIEKVENCRN